MKREGFFFFFLFPLIFSFSEPLVSCFFQNRNRQQCAGWGDPRGAVLLLLLFTCGAFLRVLLFLSSYNGELFPSPIPFIFAPLCLVLNGLLFFTIISCTVSMALQAFNFLPFKAQSFLLCPLSRLLGGCSRARQAEDSWKREKHA